MDVFSPAQWVGYAAFVLGIAAFLQKSDVRLKLLNAAETLAYTAHFAMLGNLPASASSFVSCGRSLLAMRFRSAWLAFVFIAVNVGVGAMVVTTWTGWLPVVGSSLTTVAVFLLQGIPMRLTILVATLLWLANNILSGSIGGTVLELFVALANITTILRMRAQTTPRDAQ